MKQTILLLLYIVCCLIPLSGCRSPLPTRDAERLRLVTTLSADGAGPVHLSASAGEVSDALPGLQLSAEGESIAAAAEALRLSAGAEELYFSHLQFLLCGEEAARGGLTALFDYFERSAQLRLTIPFYIVRGEAGELIEHTGEQSEEVTALLTTLRESARREGRRDATLLTVLRSLSLRGSALVSVLAAEEAGKTMPSSGEGVLLPRRDGYAVLSESAPLFFLPGEAELGAELLTGQAEGRELTLPCGAAVKLTGAGLSLDFADSGAVSVRLAVSAALSELGGDAPSREQIEAELSDLLRETLDAALTVTAEHTADFAGLYGSFRRQHPESTLSREAFLSSLIWDCAAEGELTGSYDTAVPGGDT